MSKPNHSVERTMFYGAKPIIFERAKELRQNPTKAEKVLWDILRKKQMLDLRFKQQHPINIFIADFYCHAIKLVIEVDGEIHNIKENKEYDKARTNDLENYGITVIRFSNKDVLEKIEEVKIKIEKICKKLLKT
ncbi:MAG: endonuclease domain-containing protein [Bacteroidales bacterium]|jgi:very-short-patch-repair endonuclease|nr:endonuclease domain-containing protein [Bacteroidales bacterium]